MTDDQRRLVEDNIWVVGWAIHKYYPNLKNDEDVYQVGCMGLIKAAIVREEDIGEFSTYATKGVRFAIWNYFKGLNQIKRKSNCFSESLDKVLDSDTDLKLMDVIGDCDDLSHIDAQSLLNSIYTELEDRDKFILEKVIEGKTYREIAPLINTTHQTVSNRMTRHIRPKVKELMYDRKAI